MDVKQATEKANAGELTEEALVNLEQHWAIYGPALLDIAAGLIRVIRRVAERTGEDIGPLDDELRPITDLITAASTVEGI